jgi:hypothetical protein
MAKKNLGNLEESNKNMTGVGALFNVSPKVEETAKGKKEADLEDEEEVTGYPLRMKKSWLKKLKIISANTGTSVKDLILNPVADKYNL